MPKSLEQHASGQTLEVVNIPVDAIDYQPGNPNYIAPALMETLRADIRDQGFAQPILVREEGSRYRMVDGEHRHRIVVELGWATIPAVIAGDISDVEAKLRLLSMNRLRGEPMPLPNALMLADLVRTVPESELRRRLGYDEMELRDALALADFTDDASDLIREHVRKEAEVAPRTLRFVVTQRDGEVIDRVITSLTDGKRDSGQALAYLCREHEKASKKGK